MEWYGIFAPEVHALSHRQAFREDYEEARKKIGVQSPRGCAAHSSYLPTRPTTTCVRAAYDCCVTRLRRQNFACARDSRRSHSPLVVRICTAVISGRLVPCLVSQPARIGRDASLCGGSQVLVQSLREPLLWSRTLLRPASEGMGNNDTVATFYLL